MIYQVSTNVHRWDELFTVLPNFANISSWLPSAVLISKFLLPKGQTNEEQKNVAILKKTDVIRWVIDYTLVLYININKVHSIQQHWTVPAQIENNS